MKRPVLPIVIAVLLAIGAALVVFFYARGAESRALAEVQPVDVLVSTAIIPQGMTLADANARGMVQTQQVPVNLKPPGVFDSVTSSNGALLALTDIPVGLMLQSADFAPALPESIALEVPDGMLAVSVRLDDPAKVGTFLRPGSEIAIYDTLVLPTDDPNAGAVRTTRLLLGNVSVLAIGPTTEAQEATASQESWQNLLVTVAVDQKQAEKLIHATQTGALYLGLQGDGVTFAPSTGVSDEDLFN